jgi:protoporphyrinogen oxidase
MDPLENLRNPKVIRRARHLLSARGRRDAVRFAARTAWTGRRLDFDDPLKGIELDGISFGRFMRERYHEDLLEYVAQPIASTLTLGMPEDISAAHGLSLARYMPPGLFTLEGGYGELAELMAAEVAGMSLNTSASRIVFEGSRVRAVEVSDGSGKGTIEADDVICTVPATLAAGLLEELPVGVTDLLARVRYSACTHVMLAFERPPFGNVYSIAFPRREGLSFSGVTENSLKSGALVPDGKSLLHVYTYDRWAREMLRMSDEEVVGRVLAELRSVEPSVPDEPLFAEVFRWDEALCLASPGHIDAVRRVMSAVRDYVGLHLAGEYCGTPSAEAAVHSGMHAASQVLQNA